MPDNNYTQDWELYEKGKEYSRRIGLYNEVDENESYYAGEQWKGVDAGGLPTPVFNIFRRVINYFIASIMSQQVKLTLDASGSIVKRKEAAEVADVINRFIEYRWEKDKIHTLLSDVLLDAAITGDAILYTWWDPTVKTGRPFEGDFVTEIVDNVNVHFGDPNTSKISDQPYIIIVGRELTERLREEAGENGGEQDKITPDDTDKENNAGDLSEYELDDTKTTFLIKFWKKDGKVWWRKSTQTGIVRPDTDMLLTEYPIALMNWDKRKNSWHGRSVITGLIHNQRYINKGYALAMKHMMDTSFSKVVYDANRIDEWLQSVGEAIPVNGDVSNAAQVIGVGGMQSGYIDVLQKVESTTRDLIGASDAALGNVKPENTSAIIALQQASSVPLESIKRNLYQLVEDMGLIWLDYMTAYYGDGRLLIMPATEEDPKAEAMPIELSKYQDVLWAAKVEVGPSYYWSELSCISTLDNLLKMGAIDILQYLERMPDTVIPKKKELMEEIRLQREIQLQNMQAQREAQIQAMQQGKPLGAAPIPRGNPIPMTGGR